MLKFAQLLLLAPVAVSGLFTRESGSYPDANMYKSLKGLQSMIDVVDDLQTHS